MALDIKPKAERAAGQQVQPGIRLCLTADKKRLVAAGDPEAATLYCSADGWVPKDEFERLMPKAEEKREKAEPEDKQAEGGEDKAKKPAKKKAVKKAAKKG